MGFGGTLRPFWGTSRAKRHVGWYQLNPGFEPGDSGNSAFAVHVVAMLVGCLGQHAALAPWFLAGGPHALGHGAVRFDTIGPSHFGARRRLTPTGRGSHDKNPRSQEPPCRATGTHQDRGSPPPPESGPRATVDEQSRPNGSLQLAATEAARQATFVARLADCASRAGQLSAFVIRRHPFVALRL